MQDTQLTPSQIASVYSSILSTKNAISFLQNINLQAKFNGVSTGDVVLATKSVAMLEHNIGQLENACGSYFAANRSGYSGDVDCVTHYTTYNSPNADAVAFSPNNAPNFVIGNEAHRTAHTTYVAGNRPFHASHNVPFCYMFNSRSTSGWSPHHGSRASTFFYGANNSYGTCFSGVTGCRAVTPNRPFFSGFNSGFCHATHASHFTSVHTGNFSGFNQTYFSGFNTSYCSPNHSAVKSAVYSAHNQSVWSSNKIANNVGVNASCNVVWGTYKVEGLEDL
jgi:hypothetical protein